MANQKVTNIYNLLSANGLTKAKDVNEFSNWMAGSNYRQNIYGLLKQAGVEGIGSGYGEFTALTGYGKKQTANATQKAQSIGQSVFGGAGQTDYLARQDNYTRPGSLVEQLNQRDKEAEETITEPLRETAKKVQNRQFTPKKIQYVDENNKVVDEDEVYPVIPKEIAEDELNRMAYDRLQATNKVDLEGEIAKADANATEAYRNAERKNEGLKPSIWQDALHDMADASHVGPIQTKDAYQVAVENDPEYMNRVATLNLLKEADYVQKAAEQSRKTEGKNWRENTVGWFKDAAWGMKENAKKKSTWDNGESTLATFTPLYAAAEKYDRGEQLTDSERELLRSAAIFSAYNDRFSGDISSGVKSGQVTDEAVQFMAEMGINPASGFGKALQKKLVGKGIVKLVENMAESVAKKQGRKAAMKELGKGTLARVGGDILGAAVMAGTSGLQGVAGDTLQRMQGQSQFGVDANGNIQYAGRGEDRETNPLVAAAKAFGARTIQNQSEMAGAYFAPALGIGGKVLEKGLSKMKLGGVVDFIKSMGATKGAKLVDNFFEKTKWDGTIGEYAEEVVGGIENALVVGDQTLDQDPDTGVFNLQQNVETFLSVALMGGFLSTFHTGVGALSYAKGKQQLNRADYLASEALGDEWSGIKQTIDHSTTENASANLSQILSDPNMSPEQKQAVREYAKRKESLRGVLYGEESRKKEKAQEKAATRPANIDVAADGQTVVQKNQNGEVISEKKFEDEEEAKAHVDILKMQRAEQDFQDDLAMANEASEQRRQAVENGTPDDFPLSEEMEARVRAMAMNQIIPEGVEEGSPEYETFVKNMDTPGTAENDILLEMMDNFDPLEDTYETVAVLEDSDRDEIDKAINTDPVKRTERQQKLVSEVAWRLHMYNFPKGELHPEQSFTDGQTQAELDGAGTMEADPEAMLQMKQSMDDAKQALDDAVAQNTDLAAYVNETINSNEPFAPEDVISGMIGRFSDEEIATVADYINAQSKLDGYLEYTNGKIQQYVERETSKRAFKGKLNGAPSGNMVMVTDGENRYFLVNGDVQVGENGEILSAGEANGIVVVDEEGNILPMGLDSSLRVEMGATLEEYAASLLQQQQENTTAQMGFEAPQENGNNESDESNESNGTETETPPLTPPEGEETPEEEVEEAPQETEQEETVSDEKISEIDAALAKIPTRSSEKDSEPDYIWEDAPAEDTIDALAAINDGNMDAVSETATMMRKEAESELKKAEKLKTSGKNPIEMAKSRAENRQKVEDAQKRLDYWKTVEEQVKGLIKQAEEAPLRQAEEEDASTRAAIIEEKSDNDAKWKALHQLYDGTIADDGEILDESRPMDINELVAMNMPRNIAWESYTVDGTHVKRGLQDELGSHHTRGIGKNVGTNAFNTFLAKKGTGISIDEAIHQIWESGENELANGEKRFSDQEIRNAVIDMFLSAERPSDITNYVVNNRSRLANEKMRQEEEYMREQEANAYADAEAQARGFADADEEADYNEFIAEEIKLQAEYEQRTEEGTAEQMPPVAESAEGGEQGEGGTAESAGTEREVPLSEPGETETEGNTESGNGDNAADGGVHLEGRESTEGVTPTPALPEGSETAAEGEPSGTVASPTERIWKAVDWLNGKYGYTFKDAGAFIRFYARKGKAKGDRWIKDKFPPKAADELIENIAALAKQTQAQSKAQTETPSAKPEDTGAEKPAEQHIVDNVDKAPKGIKWSEKTTDKGYTYKNVQLGVDGNDLYIRQTGTYANNPRKEIIYKVKDFKSHSINDVLLDIIDQTDAAVPRHVEDALRYFYRDNGINPNSILRPAFTPSTEEVKEEPKKEVKNPSGNKLVTDERYEELKKRMRDRLLGQVNIGVDPEILALGVEMAVYHIEKGARKFAEYAKAMIEDMGDVIRPYLKAFYNGARDLPEMEELSKEMDDYGTVQSFDVANFDKQTADPMAQAQQIRDEEKVEKDAETAKESLNYDKQDTGTVNVNKKENKKKKKSVSLQEIDLFNQNTENNEQEIRRNNGLQEEPVSSSEGEGQEAGGTERVREGGSPEQDRSEQPGLSDSVEETEAKPQPQEKKNQRNNRNERGKDYAPTSATARVNANVAAIELLKRLEEENRDATPEEMAVLKQYSGWGGLGGAFNENSPLYNKVREVLDDAEYDSAAMSINSAYFTPASVIDRLWDVATKLGFKGGNILESSAGIGNIIASMPESMNERSDIEMVEIDSISGRILAKLYPDAKVNIKGFEDTRIENGSIDLAITNVPFVTGLKVRDEVDTDLSRQFGNIHDFVIAKNIRKLKEGGIGIFITTSNTLDKSDALREWIDGKGDADVMGVFRLNNATFEGTTVTSDIIVVRKRVNGERHPDAIDVKRATVVREGEYEDSNGKYDWKTGRYEMKRTSMKMNAYLSEHPENMGGEMAFAYEKGDTFRPGSYGLYPSADKSQAKMLDAWVSKMKNVFAARPQSTQQQETENTDVREGRMFVKDGKIYVSQKGKSVPYSTKKAKVKGKSVEECAKDYVAIRESLGDVLKYQLENEGDEGLKPLLDKLNKAYDNFVKKYGYLHKNVAISFLRDDIEFPDIAALENYSESKDMEGNKIVKVGKSKVFEGRVLRFKTEPKPQSVKDGVLASVQQFGRIDIPWIASSLPTQRTEQDVKADILREGYGFEDPITRKVEVRYEYLSGNVREKLRQARENNEDGRYDKNIEELEKVVPMDIPAHLIDFQLGSSWVDPKLYEDYVWDKYGCRVKFVNAGGAWSMEVLSGEFGEKNRAGGVFSRLFNITIPASKLVEAAINNRTVKVQRTEKNWDGTKETITDKEASQSCQNRIGEIKDEFTDWAKARMQEDVDMAEKMMRVYNDKFNAMVPKEVDDTFIPEQFEGAASYIHLYPHQSKAVMRAITEPVMLAHQVGAGKTFTLITTAMEMRRLGTAKKPMIVVQNATVGQFVAAAKTLYPNAKILSLTEKDRDAEGRRAFYGKIKYNDWDMIVIPQSTFERIPDSPERQLEFIQEKIDDKMHALDVARQANADSRLLNQMEKDLEDLENEYADVALGKEPTKKKGKKKDEEKAKQNVAARAKEQLDRHADDVMYFDEMGIDALLIDEAHEYKRLGFSTTMTRGVKGIDPAGSKKSAGVYLKSRGILKNNGWKNVVFATGTPISNTAAEIWTFMRYLMPREVMEANEIWYFDDFVHNFGKVSQSLEFATNGKFKENTRFAAYINKPELIRIWSTVADTVLAKDMPEVDAKLPSKENGKDQDVFLPQTQSLIGIMKAVRKRLEEFEKMSGAEKRANSSIPLVMYGLAKRAAIDPRLVDEGAVDEPNSKTNKAVGEVVKDLKDTERYKGTVAIFCDMQNGPGGFNIFQEMKRKLMEQGIPENQIAIITSGMTINAKEKIFEQVNSGDIRVIMGSTQTLGTGVNIQERLHLLIHMDAPDRPMDYTQRNGRILRQGNLHKDWGLPVRILRFGVEDSLDVTSYQRLKTKSGFIDSIMDGKAALQNNQVDRTLEEEEEGLFDNPVAVLSGSQYALKKTQAERELRKWQSKKQQWESDQIYIENTLRRNNGQNRKDEENIKEYEKQIELAKQHFPEGKATTITIKGVETKTQEELDKAITEQVNKPIRERVEAARKDVRFESAIVKIPVKFDDLTITVEAKITRETEYVQGKGMKTTMHTVYAYKIPELGLDEYSPTRGYMKDVIDDIKSDIAAESVTDRKEAARKAIAQRTKDNEMLEARRSPSFKDEDKLNAAREKVAEYTEKMKEEMAEKEAKYAAMDAEEVDIEAIEDNAEEDDDEGTRLREVDSVFFSNAERAVESIKQEKATPEQWLKMIEKNGGLKAGEDKWMGLSEWLKGQDKKSLTKQEVLDFIRENQIQIEEVNYSEKPSDNVNARIEEVQNEFNDVKKEIASQLDEFKGDEDASKQLQEYSDYLYDKYGAAFSLKYTKEEGEKFSELVQKDVSYKKAVRENKDVARTAYRRLSQKYGEGFSEAFELRETNNNSFIIPVKGRAEKFLGENLINDTRRAYTTQGLDNKKEIALTVPTVESWNEDDDIHFGDAGEGRAVAWIRFGETTIPIKPTQEQLQSIYKERADFERKMFEKYGEKDTYLKMSDEERQELDRIAGKQDSIGTQRVLVIDEIQSKRHQEGREKGYKEDYKRIKEEYEKAKKEANDYFDALCEKYPDEYDVLYAATEEEREKQKQLDRARDAAQMKAENYANLIPNAPFEKNWHELAMKRMLRYAAENGYDKVAWTKGEQQAERYNLSSVVSKIEISLDYRSTEERPLYEVFTYNSANNIIDGASGMMNTERLGETFGKELAVKLAAEANKKNGEQATLSGEGLKVGGEGMKGFYDQILPRFMDKYGKKWGVKTGEVKLPNVEEAGRKMWSVDVTPEMKESVMQGQPLFREGSAPANLQPAEKMKEHLTKLSKKIGTKVVFHDDASTITNAKVKDALQRGKKVAGWFDPKDNSVHFYMPNIKDRYEAEKTIWHEVVGHKGMRALLGEEGYRTFMRRLWMDKSEDFEEMHQWVVENYMRYGGNLYETIDEWFAYNVVEPSVPKTMWDKVMQVLSDVLRKLGFMTTPNMKDMKYMLWLSRNAIREGDAWTELQRNATLAKLDLESRRRASAYGKDAARARDGFANTPTGDTEREMYRNGLMRKMFAWTEAHQDYMASAKLLMDAILKGRKVLDRFNFYMKENHADSKIKIMEDLYVRDYCKPMEDAINRCVAAIGGKLSEAYEVLEDYMTMKHGLERNREFFVRDWMEEKRKKTPTIDDLDEEAKSEYESAVRGIEQGFEDGQIETEEERDAELKKALEDSYSSMLDRIEEGWAAAKAQPTDNLAEWLKGLDDYIRQHIDDKYEAGKHDYSGLTSFNDNVNDDANLKDGYDYDDDAVIGYVMDMESKIGEENVTELWEQKGRMTQFALDIEHEAGLITDKNYDKVSQMFHWYMPLRKWDEDMAEDIWSYMNSKKNTYVGRTLMKAGGRKSRAAMPIGTMFAMGGNAISRAARNEVKKAFAGFVRMYERPAANNDNDHDNDPLVTELEAWVENLGTEENPDWVYSFPDIPENATADEVREAKDAWAQHMLELMQEGRAMRVRQGDTIPYRFESKKRSRPEHIIEVYEEGQPHFFIVNDNPRAAQAINGQLKPETKHKITAQINRFMSSVFTSYSPTFMARNAFRDAEFASSMLSVKEGWDYCQKFMKNYMKVTNFVGKRPLMFTLFRKFRDGTLDESDKMERYFKEFAENGGITGYVMENNAERWEKEILAGVKEIGENQVVGITKNIIMRFMEGVEHAGEAIENAARFATYVTSRESGRTVTKSVNDAKEVSVNFNRKGAGHKTESLLNEKGEKTANNVWAAKTAQYMRANTLFYNASLQGVMNTVGNAARKPWWFAAKFAIPPMVLGALVPVFNAWVHAMLDDDDDKVSDDPYADLPEYTRRMNMCLYIGHGKFLMIPISIEHRAFFGLGDIMAGQTYDEKLKNVDKPLAVDAVSQLTAFSPVDYNSREMGIEGVTGWGVGLVVPAYISPLVNAYFNKSWKGSQIQRENAFGGSNLPEYQKAKDYTSKTLVGASRMWHELWGGNDAIRAGREQDSKVMEWIGEVSPAKMEYIVEQYFGEPGKLGTGVSDMFSMMFGKKEADLRKIPVVKAFATLPNENTQFRRANTKYWKYRDEFKKVEQDDRQYRSRIDDDPVLKLEYENKFKKSKRYKQWRIYHPGKGGEGFKYKKNIEDLQKRINAEDDLVQKRGLQHERNILVQQLVDTLDNIE